MSRPALMLLLVLLCGCAAREPRCERQLRPINVAVTLPSTAGSTRVHP